MITNKNIKISFLIVLGGGVDKNEEITPHSKLRHNLAIKYEKEYNYIICSSYKTYKPKAINQKKSEAKAGEEYLISKGVDKSKILLEETSKDTFSNAYYTRKLIEKFVKENNFNLGKITIITSKFHIPKTKFLFEIVFPKEKFNIDFIESENGPIDTKELENRIISENEVINFYKKHLFTTYKIIPGNMQAIKEFMEKYNPAMIGKMDSYHLELTNTLNLKLNKKDPLY